MFMNGFVRLTSVGACNSAAALACCLRHMREAGPAVVVVRQIRLRKLCVCVCVCVCVWGVIYVCA